MVELRGVSKVYARAGGARVGALTDVTLEIKSGELAVVLGPPAAGKSTLLRLITGEERPTRGAVLVEGAEVGRLGARALARLRRRLGVVPQSGLLLEDRTALDNVIFLLRARGLGAVAARTRARQALADAGLAAVRHAYPRELVASQRYRLLLARALATGPQLLLVDEPAPLLSPDARGPVVDLLRGAHRRGVTCLVVTATPELAAALEGRCLRLERGHLRPEDPAA